MSGAGPVDALSGPEERTTEPHPSGGALFASLATLLDEIRTTSATGAKRALLARYLATLREDDLRWACTFLSGTPLPAAEPPPGIGWAAIADIVRDMTKVSPEEFQSAYLARGDLGDAAADLLARYPPPPSLFPGRLMLGGLGQAFRAIAASQGASSRRYKMEALRDLLLDATPLEAKYLVRILTSDLRIGLREGLLLDAIAAAFARPADAVRRAALLLGDTGEVAVLAHAGTLDEARLKGGQPFRFMLASALENPADALTFAPPPLLVEDKYDGVRVQAHRVGERILLFSRTLEDVTATFPELHRPLASLGHTFVLDGEIVAWQGTRPLGFAQLQQRLQRRDPGKIVREIPVVLMVFDLLHLDGRDFLELPLGERRAALERLGWSDAVRLSTATLARTPEEIESRFRQAREAGHEGIVMKRPDSPYEPGRRGRLWMKWKPGVATLDVVVVAAEYGHGKRAGVLSDYTFAVRDGERLATIGKAYSGLSDAEIATLTSWFQAHTAEDLGPGRRVEPRIVLEVAFDLITVSTRHDSGFALRFPRIVRIRDDKPPEEINTLDDVRVLHARLMRGAGAAPAGSSQAAGAKEPSSEA